MKFEAFKKKYKHYPVVKSSYFSLEENPAYLRRLVSEWSEKGLLLPLRRGMYLINDEDIIERTERLSIANQIYEPSYVSLESALSFYGVIPEGVAQVTSISTRKTAQFTNSLGRFSFSKIKNFLFWGYEKKQVNKNSVIISTPEKALLDLIYLRKGEFLTADDVVESLRLQNLNIFSRKSLLNTATRFAEPRVIKVCEELLKLLPRREKKK